MKKNPEVTVQTRQNLMDAFWALYCQKRIEKITAREIADKAGYNRGTFYEYFGNVYASCNIFSLIARLNQNGTIGMLPL